MDLQTQRERIEAINERAAEPVGVTYEGLDGRTGPRSRRRDRRRRHLAAQPDGSAVSTPVTRPHIMTPNTENMQATDDAWYAKRWTDFEQLHDAEVTVYGPGGQDNPTRGLT